MYKEWKGVLRPKSLSTKGLYCSALGEWPRKAGFVAIATALESDPPLFETWNIKVCLSFSPVNLDIILPTSWGGCENSLRECK